MAPVAFQHIVSSPSSSLLTMYLRGPPAVLHSTWGMECTRRRPDTADYQRLFAQRGSGSPSVGPDGKARKASFYKRPAKAVEMGGGFFIPGLEGYRLRLFTALLVVILLTLNRFPGYDAPQSQVISEYIGLGAAVVLIGQALIEKAVTDAAIKAAARRAEGSEKISPPDAEVAMEFSTLEDPGSDDDARWAGYALGEILGACAVALVDQRKGLLYSKGVRGRDGKAMYDAVVGCFKEGSEVAVLSDAAALGAALAALEVSQRGGVVVRRVGQGRVLIVVSEGSLSKKDLVWVEQAGALLEQPELVPTTAR